MFKISHKHSILRYAIVGSIVVAVLTTATLFVINKLQNANAATTTDGAEVTVVATSGELHYGAGGYYTRGYGIEVKDDGTVHYGTCAQPSKSNPSLPGMKTVADKLEPAGNNGKLIKMMLYVLYNNNADTRSFRELMYTNLNGLTYYGDVASSTFLKEYVFTHAMIGIVYSGDTTGLSQSEINVLNSAIETVRNAVNGGTTVWQKANTYTLYRTQTGNPAIQDVVWIEPNDDDTIIDTSGKITVKKCDKDLKDDGCTAQAGANFKNIKFTLRKNSETGEVVGTTTFGKNDVAYTFTGLELGVTYYVTEESSGATAPFYKIDASPRTQSVTLNESTKKKTFKFYDSIKRGDIAVNKEDAETGTCTAALTGTKFTLVNKTGGIVVFDGRQYNNNADIKTVTLSDNDHCHVTFEDLPYGSYSIRETPSSGYSAETLSQSVEVDSANGNTVTFRNISGKGSITIRKKDSRMDEPCNPSGSASFEGIKVKLVNAGSTDLDVPGKGTVHPGETAVDEKDLDGCSVSFTNLPYGTYKAVETNAGPFYEINTAGVDGITITYDNPIVTEILENEPKGGEGRVLIKKIDIDTGSCTPTGAAYLMDASFELINENNKPIVYRGQTIGPGASFARTTLAGAENCEVAFIDIPYGNYAVHEYAPGMGYDKYNVDNIYIDDKKPFTIDPDHTFVDLTGDPFTNKPKYGTIRVKKVDSNLKSISDGTCRNSGTADFVGTTFDLINANDSDIYIGSNFYRDRQTIESKSISSSDSCSVEFMKVPYGKYYIRENGVSNGYNDNTQIFPVTIDDTITDLTIPIDVTVENTPKLGKIVVKKVDSELQTSDNECKPSGNSSFNNTTFQLFSNNDKPVYIGTTLYAKNDLIATEYITRNGCTVEFANLPLGKYTIKELIAGYGYNVSEETVQVEITSITDNQTFEVRFANTPKKGKIQVDKKDSSTGICQTVGNAVFTGVKFSIINRSDKPIYYNGHEYGVGDTIDEKNLNVVDCTLTFDNLPYGKYDVKETATNASYQVNNTIKSVDIPTDDNTVVSVSFTNSAVLGKITVNKKDSDTGTCDTVGNTSFVNTQFKITNNSDNPVYYNGQAFANGAIIDTKAIDTSSCTVVFDKLPYGSYIIEEVTAGNGYHLNSTPQTVTIPTNNSVNVSTSFTNTAITGNVSVVKNDEQTKSCTPVGDATLAGTTFMLYNKSDNPVYYTGSDNVRRKIGTNKTANDDGNLIDTITINGECKAEFKNLPYGNYDIVEKTASTGYRPNTAIHSVAIPENDGTPLEISNTFENESIKGDITVKKKDAYLDDTETCRPEGDASFAGTKFAIYNKSANPIYYKNRWVGRGNDNNDNVNLVDIIEINNSCEAKFENLPYGRYTIVEKDASYGYQRNEAIYDVTIPTNNNLSVAQTYSNKPILGKLKVNKIDTDTGTCTNLRGLSFKGTVLTIINRSANPIYYDDNYGDSNLGRIINPGDDILTKTLADNECSFEVNNLPYGTYEIVETEASKGYMKDSPKTVQIPGNSSNLLAPAVETTVSNQPIRGDLKFVKQDSNNERPMSNAVFSITQVFTEEDDPFQLGETHIVVTNEEGIIDTSSSFILHTNNTNGYDPLYDEVEPPLSYLGYGTWFGQDENGVLVPARDDVGALPYGRYIIQELRCNANLFCTGVLNEKITVKIDQHGTTLDLGDWDNACTKFTLDTEAEDAKDGDQYVEASKDATIIDTIDYCVKANVDFRIVGVLMDKETRAPLLINGEQVTNEVQVRLPADPDLILDEDLVPPSYCSEVKMSFNLDASEIAGKELVVFETLYYKDEIITEHHDFDDDSQTVNIVSMGTYAENAANGEKLLPLDEDADIKDTVKYCLKPGQEYTIKGTVMDKETGNGLLVNSELVEEELTFTPEEACGELEMHFKFNTANLGGKDLVVFEELYLDGHLIIKHSDINDQDQTVSVIPPVPDTGFFSNGFFGGSNGGTRIIIVVGVAVTVGLGGYIVYRRILRKKFLNRF